jgi:hypothetical protein
MVGPVKLFFVTDLHPVYNGRVTGNKKGVPDFRPGHAAESNARGYSLQVVIMAKGRNLLFRDKELAILSRSGNRPINPILQKC